MGSPNSHPRRSSRRVTPKEVRHALCTSPRVHRHRRRPVVRRCNHRCLCTTGNPTRRRTPRGPTPTHPPRTPVVEIPPPRAVCSFPFLSLRLSACFGPAHLRAPATPGGQAGPGKDFGAVSVVHGGIVDLALYKPECQRAVGGHRALWARRDRGDTTDTTRQHIDTGNAYTTLATRQEVDRCLTNAGWPCWMPSSRTM